MDNNKYFFAVDLGATSGRTILGTLNGTQLEQEELTRFPNNLIETGGHFYWDIYALYSEMIRGLKEVARRDITLTSIGIDTWGVDFVFIGEDNAILRNPMAYRDPHTFGKMEEYFEKVIDKKEVYGIAGIQFMNFNSLFQLYAMQQAGNSAYQHCKKILFLPDALSWMLTGEAVCEYTIASTSEMLDPRTGDLSEKLVKSVGLTREHFGRMVQPGTQIGVLTKEVQQITGLGAVPVIAVAGHDTGSAVAAVPAKNEQFAYLSSGTWSLMGIETKQAIINERSYDLNFTNEGGVEGTTRFLKNICGMWLYERCRKEWPEEVRQLSHPELQGSAMQVEAFRSIINPDDDLFANPPSMIEAIQGYCRQTGQPVPEQPSEICRCIFDSLALRYRQVFQWLKEFADFDLNVLHIIGGGSLNKYLNQFTADSLGVEVLAGPQECTAIGNIMMQAKAAGLVDDIWQMRRLIAASVEMVRYEPSADTALWDEGYKKYIEIINKKG
ncbi:MAG: rhamnulokinase [Prevotella sp.]|nr:rhamnulokinase [Prevotella sp.]MBQ6031812.1 rhamnulokinase [Prevotella sp.]MBQ6309132.1 rhamnulokinase [Prevotella sp.]MBQ7716500.1 rhamnulokinase [Prevotella sp.]